MAAWPAADGNARLARTDCTRSAWNAGRATAAAAGTRVMGTTHAGVAVVCGASAPAIDAALAEAGGATPPAAGAPGATAAWASAPLPAGGCRRTIGADGLAAMRPGRANHWVSALTGCDKDEKASRAIPM
ncbi:hypothetical protein Acidovoranil_16300 [Acidovorax sp. FG27]